MNVHSTNHLISKKQPLSFSDDSSKVAANIISDSTSNNKNQAIGVRTSPRKKNFSNIDIKGQLNWQLFENNNQEGLEVSLDQSFTVK